MMFALKAKQLSACGLQGCKVPPPVHGSSRRLLVKAPAVLSLSHAATLSHKEVSDARPDISLTPPSTPAESSCPSPAAVAVTQQQTTALRQALGKLKNAPRPPQRLFPLLGAAVVLGMACAGETGLQGCRCHHTHSLAACCWLVCRATAEHIFVSVGSVRCAQISACVHQTRFVVTLNLRLPAGCVGAVLPLPGILACMLLLSAVALMEAFWKNLLPGHLADVLAAGSGQHTPGARRRAAVHKVCLPRHACWLNQ